MTNVVAIPMQKRVFAIPLDKLDSFEGRKKIAQLLRTWERSSKENTYGKMARKVGLCSSTVANIASETTVYPRMHTILCIMGGLGFTAVRFE
jgi:hypothetical protein